MLITSTRLWYLWRSRFCFLDFQLFLNHLRVEIFEIYNHKHYILIGMFFELGYKLLCYIFSLILHSLFIKNILLILNQN